MMVAANSPPEFRLTSQETANTELGLCVEQQDRYRLELAQTLHKEVAGNLVACMALTEILRLKIDQGAELKNVAQMVTQLDATLRQTIQEMRELSEEQCPPSLKAFGLHTALRELIEALGRDFPGSLSLEHPPQEWPWEPLRRLNLYRLIEALLDRSVNDSQAVHGLVVLSATNGRGEVCLHHKGNPSIWVAKTPDLQWSIIQARCTLLGAKIEMIYKTEMQDVSLRLSFPLSVEVRPSLP